MFFPEGTSTDSTFILPFKSTLFAAFCEHLLQLWRFQVQDMLRLASCAGAGDFAVAGLDGSLLYIGARLCERIAAAHPGWSGSRLPGGLLEQLPKAPCVLRLGRATLTLNRVGEQVLLALQAPSRSSALAPRGREKLGAALAVGTAVPLAYLGLAGRKKAMARIGQTKSGLIEDALIVAAGAAVVAMATGRRR